MEVNIGPKLTLRKSDQNQGTSSSMIPTFFFPVEKKVLDCSFLTLFCVNLLLASGDEGHFVVWDCAGSNYSPLRQWSN